MISNFFFFQEMNNTKRIHAKKFYIPLYIPPLNFRKYNSSITFSSSFMVLQTSQELNPAKNIWKPSSPTTFQHFSRKADNKNAIRTDSKTGCTNVIIVSAVLNSTLGRGAILH